ncbi:MAG: AAA family ATPase [Synechococcus sp. ELA057]
MSDLFQHRREQELKRIAPLADRLRPARLEDFVGQQAILGPGRLLRRAIAADRVGNLILHGPPGTGKTTLARIIAGSTRAHFSSLNAVLAGVKDLRAEVEAAQRRLEQHGLRTILFIDEVHRFNAAQQDALLPWVENGTLTLIGATTENPFFEVNKALVSRSRLFRLQPLERSDLEQLLQRALRDEQHGYGARRVELSPEATAHLLDVAGGDARSLLNALELAVETTEPGDDGSIHIDLAIAEDSIQQRAVLYDKQGDAHFDTISAFIKSIRGSDPDAALFWLARMIEAGENPRFILRRLLISAGEDIGLADPQAMVVVEACAAAFERIGLPEGLYPLAHATLYLAATEKSNSSLGFFDAVKAVRESNRQQVPAHLRDANRDGAAFGDGVGYRYPHAYAQHWVAQQYLPSALQGEVFWQPGALGWEGNLRPRLQQRRAAQLAAAAESACDPPEWLSSSGEDRQLMRWLQRQAAAEGERLDQLRRRFWQGASVQRLDRVLVLEARSLLWALDPLEAAAEGEVVIALRDQAERDRLEAQLQLLDPLRRPRLLLLDPSRPAHLEPWLEPGERFAWIAARQPFRNDPPECLATAVQDFSSRAEPAAQARFLFSDPLEGPAGSLLAVISGQDSRGENLRLLQQAAALETPELETRQGQASSLASLLAEAGWELEQERWEETLSLPLSDGLLQRWLGAGSGYRAQLAAGLEPQAIASLAALFERQRGVILPQRLVHVLLKGQARTPASEPKGESGPGTRGRSKGRRP